MTNRKPRPDYLTRFEAEAMIVAAVAAERDRSEKAMAAVLLAIGEAARSMEMTARAIVDMAPVIDRHEAVLRPMAEAFEAALAAEGRPAGTVPN